MSARQINSALTFPATSADEIAITADGSLWASRFNPFFPDLPAGLIRYDLGTDAWEWVRPLGGDVDVPAALHATAAGNLWVVLADYGAMKSVGLMMTLGVGACMLAALLVLPAVLVLLKRAK